MTYDHLIELRNHFELRLKEAKEIDKINETQRYLQPIYAKLAQIHSVTKCKLVFYKSVVNIASVKKGYNYTFLSGSKTH